MDGQEPIRHQSFFRYWIDSSISTMHHPVKDGVEFSRWWFATLLISYVVVVSSNTPALAQNAEFGRCTGVVFSTEEDFLTRGPLPADGNPIISDGDLIARDPMTGATNVCARNRDLVQQFDVVEDMGVDAVDVIMAEKGVIAFSTELDSPHENFTDGDVLFPNGTTIPNAVLVHKFNLRDNVGLDAVHFIGGQDEILRVIEAARSVGRDELIADPNKLLDLMKELEVDIWFSIEGTGPTPKAPGVLDGDLLSALTGTKVVPQDSLLSPPIPAGVPKRGVDFGLDAVTGERKHNIKRLLFSTEILYRGRPAPFTDGDVLRLGGSVAIKNETLVNPLEPAADFLGLDAISLTERQVAEAPHLDTLCGDFHDAADFDSFGLWHTGFAASPPGSPPRRPCGLFVPVDGTLTPSMDVKRFRIAYRPATSPAPPVGSAPGIHTEWKLRSPHPITWICSSAPANIVPLSTDGSTQEWMDAKNYLDGKMGDVNGISGNGFVGCGNSGLRLAVWNTLGLPTADQNGHFIVWLEWETNGGIMTRDAFEYHVQLDNKAPELPPYPNALQVKLADGSGKVVPACGDAPSDASKFEVWAQFDDPYYWYSTVTVEGGLPPVSVTFPGAIAPPPDNNGDNRYDYWETYDGTPGLKNTDATGTTPDGLLVHLRDIDMTALGGSFKRCCYLLRLWVYDASIRHGFNGFAASPTIPHRTQAFVTFSAG